MYTLVQTARYTQELDEIEAGAGHIEDRLRRGVYLTLQRRPSEGSKSEGTGIYIIRQRIIQDLLIVQIYYRIHEEANEVHLLSMRVVNMLGM